MSKKLLNDYLYAMLSGFVAQAKAISTMKHELTKGQIREFFIQNLLKHFLPDYLATASGIVMNNRGEQSKQTDIIVYDTRLLPPFLFSDNLNIFPIESVISTIEVKSHLNRSALLKTDKDATHLIENIFKNNRWLVPPHPPHLPLLCLFGFDGTRIQGLSTSDNTWITENIKSVRLICTTGKFSWVRLFMIREGETERRLNWVFSEADENFKEIRRFMAILVDNLRTIANGNWLWSFHTHQDLLGQYIRYLG